MRISAGPSLGGFVPVALMLAALGCASSSPRSAGPGAAAAVPVSEEIHSLFDADALRASEGILAGLSADGPESSGSWRPGDAVLLGLVFERGAERTVRFLKVESPAEVGFASGSYTLTSRIKGAEPIKVSSPMFITTITLYDEAGAIISSTPGQFPMDCIGRGAYLQQLQIIDRVEAGLPLPVPPEELRAMPREELLEGLRRSTWMIAIAPSMGSNPAMQKLMTGLAETPPLLSLLFGTDLSISTVGLPARDRPVVIAGREYPAASMSLALAINSRPVLEGSLKAVPAVSPLHLCGGLTELEARNPAHPERRVHVRLLASRRGVPPRTQ
ncbi:MAG: hypothetical protein IT436_01210 [Phycisphaerales bacterium]|nr:hypothetical protein [Phycisphaerales bacterium]